MFDAGFGYSQENAGKDYCVEDTHQRDAQCNPHGYEDDLPPPVDVSAKIQKRPIVNDSSFFSIKQHRAAERLEMENTSQGFWRVL